MENFISILLFKLLSVRVQLVDSVGLGGMEETLQYNFVTAGNLFAGPFCCEAGRGVPHIPLDKDEAGGGFQFWVWEL